MHLMLQGVNYVLGTYLVRMTYGKQTFRVSVKKPYSLARSCNEWIFVELTADIVNHQATAATLPCFNY
jgi:hypothetical protein